MRAPRVLVAYDGSEGSAIALSAVSRMPWPPSTRIRIIAVRDAHLRFLRPLVDEMLFFELEQHVLDTVRWVQADVPAGVTVEHRVLRGSVLTEITNEAEGMDADLVVLGSRNRGPVRSAILGSVGRQVVARDEWPVLIARGDRFDRVLLAHDGSDASRAAVRMVGSWPIFTHASVKMFSVAHTEPAAATAQVLTACALEDADLIILGSAAAHGLDRLVHGDLADGLVARTRCSLLVVPATRVELTVEQPALSI